MAGLDADGVGLTLVLVHIGEHEPNDIRTNGSREDARELDGAGSGVAFGAENTHYGTGSSLLKNEGTRLVFTISTPFVIFRPNL